MNWTTLARYTVLAAAACAVVLGLALGAGDTFWATLPALIVAIYLAGRDGSCSPRRESDR